MAAIHPRYAVLIVAVLLAVVPLAGGISFADEYQGLCVDEATGERVDAGQCGGHDAQGHAANAGFYYRWVDTSDTVPIPALGQHVPVYIGSRTLPGGDITATVERGCATCH